MKLNPVKVLIVLSGLLFLGFAPRFRQSWTQHGAPRGAVGGVKTMSETPARTNRLAEETSPYLLQHAHNPVDWYPWSKEAFDRAKTEDRPIFLSIGYSTCHWCHVMERESFENAEIAAVLNEHFVCIKVDREQRPDVDAVYMEAVTLMTGAGGWPLSAFLTPEGRTFYGGTYFPPEPRYGRPGFKQILIALADAWQTDRPSIHASADKIDAVLSQTEGALEGPLDRTVLESAYHVLADIYDPKHGGFGGAPKFPHPGNLQFLLAYHFETGQAQALEMVTYTLDVMSRAGMYDHLGGGFHRYATDAQWLVPHFEKMLYDQAFIGQVYLDAYKITGKPEYSRVLCETLAYVLRDLRDPGGAFYSAEDADSEGFEGKFYLWTPAQIARVLSADQARAFMAAYGVTESGNYEQGQSILHRAESVDAVAETLGESAARVQTWLSESRAILFDLRDRRVRPHCDTKIITAWNGLFISTLARAGAALERSDYVHAAEAAALDVLTRLEKDGRLMRSLAGGEISGPGFLDDYAFFVGACLDLYESTFEPAWLSHAIRLAGQMVTLFDDPAAVGFSFTGQEADGLLTRTHKPDYDGALPCGNSVAALCLVRLSRMTGDAVWGERAEATLTFLASRMQGSPVGLTTGARAVASWLSPGTEIVLTGSLQDSDMVAMRQTLYHAYLPNAVTLWRPAFQASVIEALVPRVRAMAQVKGKATAYLCEDFTCRKPVTSPKEFTLAVQEIVEAEKKRP